MLVRRICQHEQWLQDRHSAAQDFAIATCVFYHTQHLYCVPSNMQENIIKKKKKASKQASNQPTKKNNQKPCCSCQQHAYLMWYKLSCTDDR